MIMEQSHDKLYHIDLLNGQARALMARSTSLVEEARRVHSLGRIATAALGRLGTMAAILGAMLKEKGASVSCIVRGDGPLGTLIAVGRPSGEVKGYVQCPDVDLPRVNGKLPVGGAVGRHGTLTVVKDMGFGEPYSGRVNLVSGELGEDFALYFTASEQTPSLVSVGVLTAEHVEAAGGLVVQMLPGADEEAVRAVEERAPAIANISATMQKYDDQGAIEAMLGGLSPRVLEQRPLRYACDCSRERVERALISLGREELGRIIEEQDGCTVDCQFCGVRQAFTGEELAALLAMATRP